MKQLPPQPPTIPMRSALQFLRRPGARLSATHVLHRDYETRSRLDLRKVGAFIYAADVSTQVLCAAYAVDDDPVQLWWPVDPLPLEFKEAATDPAWIACAHLSNNSNSSVLSGLA